MDWESIPKILEKLKKEKIAADAWPGPAALQGNVKDNLNGAPNYLYIGYIYIYINSFQEGVGR